VNSSHYYRTPLLLTALLIAGLLLTGCLSDDDSDSGDGLRTGQLTLVGVQGLNYQTASRSGTTDSKGRFQYYPGERISFSVGNLPLASDVPASEFLTPMEFTPEQRKALRDGGVDDDGLTSHAVIEKELATRDPDTINMTRFLMTLDQDRTASASNNIRITQRTVEQINEFLLENPDFSLDFGVSTTEFASFPLENASDAPVSKANELVRHICFFEKDDPLCQEPKSPEEIEKLPPLPDDPDDIVEGVVYREDAEAEAQAIENAKRNVSNIAETTVEDFLIGQATRYKLDLESPYYLVPEALTLRRGNTSTQELYVMRAGGSARLSNLEAESKNPEAVYIISDSFQHRRVNFAATESANDKDKATLLVNFKLPGDYRWYRKQVRVFIED